MPYYDFMCDDCRLKFEVYQGMHDEHEAECSKCGNQARRLWDTSFWADAHWPRENHAVRPDTSNPANWDSRRHEWKARVFKTRREQESFYRKNHLAEG